MNFSDVLNGFVELAIKITTYYLPIIITIWVFWDIQKRN